MKQGHHMGFPFPIPGLLSAYKGLKLASSTALSSGSASLLSAYKGLKRRRVEQMPDRTLEFIKCL